MVSVQRTSCENFRRLRNWKCVKQLIQLTLYSNVIVNVYRKTLQLSQITLYIVLQCIYCSVYLITLPYCMQNFERIFPKKSIFKLLDLTPPTVLKLASVGFFYANQYNLINKRQYQKLNFGLKLFYACFLVKIKKNNLNFSKITIKLRRNSKCWHWRLQRGLCRFEQKTRALQLHNSRRRQVWDFFYFSIISISKVKIGGKIIKTKKLRNCILYQHVKFRNTRINNKEIRIFRRKFSLEICINERSVQHTNLLTDY